MECDSEERVIREHLMSILESLGGSYDWALPQSWWDECYSRGFRMNGQVVWLYSEKYESGIFGTPFPVTSYGLSALAVLAKVVGR